MTAQQSRFLAFLREYIARNGHSPNYDEIREALGLKSKAGVHRIAMALLRKGYAYKESGTGRCLKPVEEVDGHQDLYGAAMSVIAAWERGDVHCWQQRKSLVRACRRAERHREAAA